MYPFRTRKPRSGAATAKENPAKWPKADARTRTGDPFITREKQVRDGRPRAGTWRHLLAGNWVLSQASRWTRVPASARVDVPVLYPSRNGRAGQAHAYRTLDRIQDIAGSSPAG